MALRALAVMVLVPAVLLAACGGGSSDDDDDEDATTTSASPGGTASVTAAAGTPASSPSAAASPTSGNPAGDGLAKVEVSIESGSKAGEYEATLVGSGGCSKGTFGPNTFGVASVSVQDATGGFDGPQLTIFDLAGAAASGGTTQFGMGLAFDNYAVNILMSPYEGFGSGTLTIDDRGNSATIHAEGKLEDGSPATVDIECHSVVRLG